MQIIFSEVYRELPCNYDCSAIYYVFELKVRVIIVSSRGFAKLNKVQIYFSLTKSHYVTKDTKRIGREAGSILGWQELINL